MVNPEIVEYIESAVIPLYQTFDKAHGEEHVRTVIRDSLELADFCHADADMAYVVAAYHDAGMPEGRETHHLTSARLLFADANLRKWYTEEQLQVMKEAVEGFIYGGPCREEWWMETPLNVIPAGLHVKPGDNVKVIIIEGGQGFE